MSLNLAVFAPGKAGEVITANPDIQNWVIVGHSLGGAMAANFARKIHDLVDGLFFWASYPGLNYDLSRTPLNVISIYGSQDGLATIENVKAAHTLLPPETQWIEIHGVNHAQFGWYGDQPGDNQAVISLEQQQEETLMAMSVLLKFVSER
jgi:pimeloyl-ACP methyl ester carboxylesterase